MKMKVEVVRKEKVEVEIDPVAAFDSIANYTRQVLNIEYGSFLSDEIHIGSDKPLVLMTEDNYRHVTTYSVVNDNLNQVQIDYLKAERLLRTILRTQYANV